MGIEGNAPTATESTPIPIGQGQSGEPASPQASLPPQEPQSTPDREDHFSRRFELLTKKEREIYEKERIFRNQQKEYQTLQERLKSFEEKERLLKTDPFRVLEEYEWTPDKFQEYVAQPNYVDRNETQKLYQHIQNLEKKIESFESNTKQEKYSGMYQQHLGKIGEVIKSNSEKFEILSTRPDGAQTVFDVMSEHYSKFSRDEYGNPNPNYKPLTYDKAAEIAESYLDKELESLVNLNKVKNRFTPAPQGEGEQKTMPSQESLPRTNTITNSMTGTTPSKDQLPYDRDERIKALARRS